MKMSKGNKLYGYEEKSMQLSNKKRACIYKLIKHKTLDGPSELRR